MLDLRSAKPLIDRKKHIAAEQEKGKVEDWFVLTRSDCSGEHPSPCPFFLSP